MKKITSVSIAYKIHLPLVLIIIFGLSIIIFNSYLSLESIEEHAKEEIKQELQSYVKAELSKKYQISLTNAFNISINQKIIDDLKNKDRKSAYKVLTKLTENFKNYSEYDNIRIHMHDKNAKSFLRSWKYDKYGDELGRFRYSLNIVKETKKPILAIENGRVGMQMRGIAPIFDGKEFLGTIEIMQDFNHLVVDAKKNKNYSIAVFNCEKKNEKIDKFSKERRLEGQSMILSQDYQVTNHEFYKTLEKDFDKNIMKQYGLVSLGDYFVSSLELKNIKNEKIGCILIAAHKEYVNRYLDRAKEIFIQQIWILLIVDIMMLLTLIYLLNITVKKPIFNLLKNLKTINNDILDGKTLTEVYKHSRLKYKYHDEMGIISVTINALLRTMSQTFIQLQQSQKHTSEYIKAIYAGGLVSTSDTTGIITHISDELCTLTCYSKEELLGLPHSVFRDEETPKSVYKELWDKIESGKVYNGVLKNKKKDGTAFYTNTTIIPIKNEKDEIVEYISFRDDITELIKSKEELKRTSLINPLTNISNRFKMLSNISEDSYLAVLDVDFFREINDFYGYKVGDLVLIDLAERLTKYFDMPYIEVYHLNGDEFGILANSKFIKQDAFFEMVKRFLDENKNAELSIEEGNNVITRLTCGISYNSENLVNYADIAHKYAKKTNKEIVEYTNEINTDEEYKKNNEWTNELKRAIDEGRIKAYYQPIVNTKTSKIEKYETLMRLIKKDGEEVSPIFFLDIAKKTRVYKELTKIIVTQAFDKFAGTDYEFSINLSIEDIMLHDIESWIFDLALEKGVNNRLVIELVESEGIESFEMINKFIQASKEYGMKVAIDDFGTGYSNFEYLIKLNADYIKIDGSLMKDIDKNEKLYGVVETIVAFAKKNNIKVIGEFVSTKEIFEKAKLLDIDFAQGYYFGKPEREIK